MLYRAGALAAPPAGTDIQGMRGISGLSMIALLVVMAIVLLLVARSWESLAPAAMDVSGIPGMEAQAAGGTRPAGGTAGGAAPDERIVPPPGSIPPNGDDAQTPVERKFSGVRDARRTTDAHTRELEEALKKTE